MQLPHLREKNGGLNGLNQAWFVVPFFGSLSGSLLIKTKKNVCESFKGSGIF